MGKGEKESTESKNRIWNEKFGAAMVRSCRSVAASSVEIQGQTPFPRHNENHLARSLAVLGGRDEFMELDGDF